MSSFSTSPSLTSLYSLYLNLIINPNFLTRCRSSQRLAWFWTSTLFEACLLLLYVLVLPKILLSSLQHFVYYGPIKSLWHIFKEWWSIPPLHSDQQLLFGCLGQIWHLFDPLRSVFTPPVCFGAPQFFYACCSNVYLGPMKSLWAYIEGMVVHSSPSQATNKSDLAVWARFGTCLTLFEACLLLLYVLVWSAQLQFVCLGAIFGLWHSTLFEARLLLLYLYALVLLNSSELIAALY